MKEVLHRLQQKQNRRKGNLSQLAHGCNLSCRIKILFKSPAENRAYEEHKGLEAEETTAEVRNCLIAMGKLQFSATERRKFKAEGDKRESGEAGRKHLSAGQIRCIKASGLSPVGTEKAKSFKQENMIVYQILIQIRFSEFQIKRSKLC